MLNIDLRAVKHALTATGLRFSVVLADISRNVPRVRWRMEGKTDILPTIKGLRCNECNERFKV